MKFQRWIVLVLSCVLLLSACAPQQPGTSPVVVTDDPLDGFSTAPAPTSTPAQSAGPIPLPTDAYAGKTLIPNPQITYFHMADYLAGWAYSGTQVLHTNDGGATWYDITPGDVAGRDIMVSGSCFLDGRTAWFLLSTSETPVSLYHTPDGGLTWTKRSTPFSNGRMQFLDDRQGYAFSLLGAAAGSDAIAIYGTSDGGDTWQQIFTNDPEAEDASDSLPFSGQKSGMTYLDPRHGWVSGNTPAPGATYLYATRDGGTTWSAQELELPSGFDSAMTEIEPPLFFTSQAGVLPVRLLADPISFVFYTTQDAGATWEPAFPLNFNGRYAISSLLDLFLWDGGEFIYISHDSGESWKQVSTNVNLVMTLMQFEFVDQNTGWALTGDMLSHHTFYKTTDGGATWSLLIP